MVGIVVVAIWLNREPEPEISELMASADTAFAERDFATAHQLAEKILKRDPKDARAIVMAGKCLDAQDCPLASVDVLSKIPPGQPPYSTEAACLAGDLLFLKLYRPAEAEKFYRQALRDDPSSLEANDHLAIVLGLSGQWWRQIPARLSIVGAGKSTRLHLLVLALAENALVNPELVGPLQTVSPNDPLVLLAAARLAVEDEEHQRAIALLNRALQRSPGLVQAHVRLGTIFFEHGEAGKFYEWSRNLPPTANGHPSVWALRGRWALRHSRPRAALRCFCEAIQRDPNNLEALCQAGRILVSMKRTEQATPFLLRAKSLQEFLNAVKAADAEDALAEKKMAATLAESLGNHREAHGWASLAASHRQSPVWAREITLRLKKELPQLPLQRTHPKHNPVRTFDYRGLPLPEISNLGAAPVMKIPDRDSSGRFSFKNRAASAGVHFQYFNSSQNVANGTQRMYEVMGGGVAVLDFNADQLPDVYFTQGCRWPVEESAVEHLDRLFLNTGDGRFVDVTASCGIRENRFSQGVAVGDIDSDGFPDLLVANIGRNCLYHNDGDGTFTDISQEVGFNRTDWTLSCAIADLSGDGHPDLYFVNYLKGPDIFTRTCGPRKNGVCLPQHFPAADDRLYWNTGSGGFRDVTETSGINAAGGKGLGIVVGSFGRSRGLNVFVSNDTVANFYFENQGPGQNGVPRFRETSLLSGLAMNATGRAEACMGIAAGDADGDGAIDLFITNFHGESNTLYRQLPDGFFDDETMIRGLHQPSMSKLGFGTQFLDADLDGRLDLIVANGHIGNFRSDGWAEYQMRPQFFENAGNVGFREADSVSLGPYFTRKVLGRSLARLDWNRDGKEDAIISNLDAPVALLENTTQKTGGFLALHLRGVRTNRDAIGTIVRVETQNRNMTRQLTAGDGFQASNERILVFGLGEDRIVKKMTVFWPSRRREEFTSIPANSRWFLIEGEGRLQSAPVD